MNKIEQRQELIELRSKLVGVLHTQPHTIYNNATIEALLEAQPMSLDELTKVKGFPPDGKRVKCFGKAVVAVFNPEMKSFLEEEAKKSVEGTSKSDVNDALKKISYFALATSLVASSTLSGIASAQTLHSPAPFVAEVRELNNSDYYASTTTGSVITGVADELSDTQKRDIAVHEFYQKSKEKAWLDWNEVCAEAASTKLEKEDAKQRQDELKVEKAKKEVTALKSEVIKQTKKQLSKAKKKALSAAAEARKEAKRLRNQARKKAEKSGVNAQCLENYKSFSVGSAGRSYWKSWMPHTKVSGKSIFCESSAQFALQKRADTGKYGIRTVKGRYCIALGSAYTRKIGTKVDVVLKSGRILNCILADQKADGDTDSLNRYHLSDGSYVEFVVDRTKIDKTAENRGNFNCIKELSGSIVEIRVAR